MPTRLIQTEQHPSGTAALQITGPTAQQVLVPEELEIAIIQLGPTERYLDPRNPDDPWTTSFYRFRPLRPRREGAALMLEVDYGVTYHLRANQPYKLQVRQFEGLEFDEIFTGPGTMRRGSAAPVGWPQPLAPAAVAQTPPPAPEPIPEPSPPPVAPPLAPPIAPPVAPPVAPPQPQPVALEGGKKPGGVLLPVLAALLLLGGGAAWYFTKAKDEPIVATAAPKAEAEATLESIRAELAANPEPAVARTRAEELAKAGKLLDGQFLLFKYAGDKGDAAAARALGGFYDPDTWAKDSSPLPAPNPSEAARWHKQAAEAGDAESQYRYGMLLKQGRTEATDGPEQAVAWLRKAADQGHEGAKKALGG
jgi:hypothetical protein